MSIIDWSDIAIFLAVAETGSLSAASRRLKVSQPTVGRRVSEMERQLGVKLFVRTGRGLMLTDSGHAILENARRMGDEAQAIARMSEGRNRGLSGPVTVSVVEGLSHLWLVPLLREFQDLYPDILVRLRVEEQAANLVQREADIAIRMFQPVQQSLIARRMARLVFGFYASRDYVARRGRPSSPDELHSHDFVMAELAGRPLLRGSRDAVTDSDMPGRTVFMSNSPEANVTAVRSGLGIGIHALAWADAYPDLVRLLPETPAGDVDIWLVTHEDLRHSARIRAMYDFLAGRLAEDAEIFAGTAPPRWAATELFHGGPLKGD